MSIPPDKSQFYGFVPIKETWTRLRALYEASWRIAYTCMT